jgi:hypothetical protein
MKKLWEKIGISRATWYRHGKPNNKAEYEDAHFDCGRQGLPPMDDLKNVFGVNSVRFFQRQRRVLHSELGPYVLAECLSVAAADRILSNPAALDRTRKRLSQNRAKLARK